MALNMTSGIVYRIYKDVLNYSKNMRSVLHKETPQNQPRKPLWIKLYKAHPLPEPGASVETVAEYPLDLRKSLNYKERVAVTLYRYRHVVQQRKHVSTHVFYKPLRTKSKQSPPFSFFFLFS